MNKTAVNKLTNMKTYNILGYNVFAGNVEDWDLNKKTLINTFSPNSYGLALKDMFFKKALLNTDILVLDGIGIALGSMLIHGKNIGKIAGQDCFDHLMDQANSKGWKVFFLGSSVSTLQKIVARLKVEYPNASVATYSPPFKQVFSDTDNKHMVDAINEYTPDVLFVGMTAPKQEKWAYQQHQMVNARIVCTIGNVFDWYAGVSKRPAQLWVKLRLEWLVRIFLRPEIFRRNTKNQLMFVRDLFAYKFRLKKNY
ncbi:MAG: WecB/TagA/CpsF family glycosyltransferase [Chitinophagaceae bacterium]